MALYKPPGSRPLWLWLLIGAIAVVWGIVLIVQGNIILGSIFIAAFFAYRLPAEIAARRRH